MELTNNSDLLKTPQYHKIRDCVQALISNGDVKNFAGNSIATSDIVQVLLSQVGIQSKIIECQACVSREIDGVKKYAFVGYDNYSYPGQIDTHTVVITEGEHSILVDLSLGHILPEYHKYIVESVNMPDETSQTPVQNKEGASKQLGEFIFGDCIVTYFEKREIRLPTIHRKNLVQRIMHEDKLERQLVVLRWFIIAAITLGLTNFLLNMLTIILGLFKLI